MNKKTILCGLAVLALVFLLGDNSLADKTNKITILNEIINKVDQKLTKSIEKLKGDLLAIIQTELTTKPQRLQPAVEHAVTLINPEILKKHEYYLASDELEGRNAGYPGNDKGTEYIANVFREIGLKPIGDKNSAGDPTYFQKFKFLNDKFETRNCIGLWEGTDELLKNEYVVIGGHCDHVGRRGQENAGQLSGDYDDPKDDIWNGANDNGSGTSSILAIARAFAEGKVATKRSIIFMGFSAEEWGLFGSRHYVDNPITPLEKTVAMVNLDMVGRNPGGPFSVGGSQTFTDDDGMRNIIKDSARYVGLKVRTSSKHEWVSGNSDHASFASKDIPALFFSHGGNDPDYHKTGDSPDKICYQNMTLIARSAFLVTYNLANIQPRPQFDKNFKVNHSPLGASPHLGVGIVELKADECSEIGLKENTGGIRIASIEKNSVSEKIGLKEGDIVFSFNDRDLPAKGADREIRRSIKQVKKGKYYNLKILRNGQEMTFIAKWDEDSESIILEKYLIIAKDIQLPERRWLEELIGKEYPEVVEWLYDREQWARALKALDEKLGLWASGVDIKVNFGESQFGFFGEAGGVNGKGKIRFSVPRLLNWWNQFHELNTPIIHELSHVYTGDIGKYGAWLDEGMANFASGNKTVLKQLAQGASQSGQLLDIENTKTSLEARGELFFEFLNEKYPAQFKNFINLIIYHDEDYRSAIEEATEKEWAVISREETQWSGERLMKLINTGK